MTTLYNICVSDLITSNGVQSMANYIQHGDVTTLRHCENVSYMSFAICKALNLDYRSAARGALLHDYYLYDWHNCPPCTFHGYRHPAIAFANAHRDFPLNETESDIIKKHMWPLTLTKIPIYPESFVVCFCDKVQATIEFFEFQLERITLARLLNLV